MKFLNYLAILSIFCVAAFAAPLTDAQKQSELESLSALLRNQYGPLDFKKSELKLDLEAILPTYIEKAKKTDNRGFFYLVNQFVAEFNDSHFSSRVNSNRVSSLGFFVDRVDKKLLIESVDRNVLPMATFPFDKGDELVGIDGVSSEKLVEYLGSFVGHGNFETKRRTAAFLTTYRSGSVCPVQTGKASVEIRRRGLQGTELVELTWQQSGDDESKIVNGSRKSYADYLNLSLEKTWEGIPKTERAYRCNGITRVTIPKDATVLLQTPFVAYYHPTPKGNVGYLRIPHYLWRNAATGANENNLRFQQYEWAVQQFEKNTVGLIIDQDHNCGGSVDLVEKMVGLFADKPYHGLQFQFLATRTEYLHFKAWIDEAGKTTLDGQSLLAILDLMKQGWSTGKRLTEKTTFQAGRMLHPNSIRYTKPIVVLIDEMSGSGGDAFPAMMQGYGRAVLLGSRTMGAGGHVEEIAPLNYSGNAVRLTKSLFYHPNGQAIENNGVSPDVPYTITLDDFVGGYQQYQKAYLKTLLNLVQ